MNVSLRRVVIAGAIAAARLPSLSAQSSSLPSRLSDSAFWNLFSTMSEGGGSFPSENFISNERTYQHPIPYLERRVRPGDVYLGVGPEQNFTYVAAVKPRIAFVTDIRRGNLDLHLLYKALFEMSANRTEFVARLFSRNLVPSLPRTASAAQLMAAYSGARPVDETTFAGNLKTIIDLLTNKHGLALTSDDRLNLEHAYRAFYQFGPEIDYTSSINGRTGQFRNYATLMASVDGQSGKERGYLANDDNFAFVKTMESKNLIVPVVGDFAGQKALRAIGAWLKARGATVSVFYVSNVEDYLERNGVWPAFCANAATLPLDRSSIFIRPNRSGSSFSPIAAEIAACAGK